MRLGCGEACACLNYCFEVTQRSIIATFLTLEKIRSDPDALQKTCILASSVIKGLNFYLHANYLPRLIDVLDIAQSFDFYGFCRLPNYIFHPYAADRLDEYAILDQLEITLCHNWRIGLADQAGNCRDANIRGFAQEQLADLLENMEEFDLDLKTAEQFKTVLLNHLHKYLVQNPIADCDPYAVDLKDLQVTLKQHSFLESFEDILFIWVDLACVPAFLQDWSLINLNFIASQLPNFYLFSLLSQKSLNDWISIGMCAGYFVRFMEAFRSLYCDTLMAEEKRNAKWILAASVAEFLYNSAILQRKDPRWVVFFACIAKTLGLLQILLEPKVTFFQK